MDRTLYLECESGISGDMSVAMLLDLGADRKVLAEALKSLPLQGYEIRISRVNRNGIDCCDFDVVLEEENHDHDMEYLYGEGEGHTHAHDHEHAHEHTHEHEHKHTHEHEHSHDDDHAEWYQSQRFPAVAGSLSADLLMSRPACPAVKPVLMPTIIPTLMFIATWRKSIGSLMPAI